MKDDAYQAGCVGLVLGLKESSNKDNPDGYLFRCIRNEVLKEMATLHDVFALDTKTLLRLIKAKEARTYGHEPRTATVEEIEQILQGAE